MAEATSEQVSNPDEPNPDWRQGYGYQFWMSRHGYRGDGAFGQFCVILPEQDAVIVTTAYTLDMQAMLDAMWTHLLPGLGTVSPGTGRCARPAQGPARPPRAARQPRRTGARRLGPVDQRAVHHHRQHRDGTQRSFLPPFLTSIEVAPRAGGWQISLIEPDNALTFPVGAGGWTVSDHADRNGDTIPVAASGGWLDGQTLRAEVIFLETPHRMDITCSLPGTHRRGRVAPSAAHPEQAPAPALPPLGAPRARPTHSRVRWQFIHKQTRDSRMSAHSPCGTLCINIQSGRPNLVRPRVCWSAEIAKPPL